MSVRRKLRRIIPASAGNTIYVKTLHRIRADHPRERGEHSPPIGLDVRKIGSSPRARGTLFPTMLVFTKVRIIPARAGNTILTRCYKDYLRIIPASAGNTLYVIAIGSDGKDHPASAGNTSTPDHALIYIADHPRERGEHAGNHGIAGNMSGSSPRARGTPASTTPRRRAVRIIPASAGNTYHHKHRRRRKPDHPRERGEHASGDSAKLK